MKENLAGLPLDISKRSIKSFVGLRSIFALAIFVHHLDILKDMNIPSFDKLYSFLYEGYIGVNFFFILSGFLVTYGYERRIKENKVSESQFIFYRFARLWPLHIVTLIFSSFVYGTFGAWFSQSFWVNIFMLQSFIPVSGAAFSFNGLAWCISVEMFFYIVFCALIYLSRNKKILLLLILMGSSALTIHYSEQFNNISWLIYINPFFRLMDFVAGMILCDIYSNFKFVVSKAAINICEFLAMALLVVCMTLGVCYNVSWLVRYDLYYLIPISILILVFGVGSRLDGGGGILSAALSSGMLQYLGNISFEFYLVHQMILYLLKEKMFLYINSLKAVGIYSLLAFSLSVIVASVLHYFIGEPTYKKMRKMWDSISIEKKVYT